jgi:hypothetical protein
MWKKKDKNLPQDVRTCWNLTYDMLEVAIDYRDVIDHLCSEQDTGLRKFELDPEEWLIATQLRDLLKVWCRLNIRFKADYSIHAADIQRCNYLFFEVKDFQPDSHHSGYGSS